MRSGARVHGAGSHAKDLGPVAAGCEGMVLAHDVRVGVVLCTVMGFIEDEEADGGKGHRS